MDKLFEKVARTMTGTVNWNTLRNQICNIHTHIKPQAKVASPVRKK